jgi:hypothetical protein
MYQNGQRSSSQCTVAIATREGKRQAAERVLIGFVMARREGLPQEAKQIGASGSTPETLQAACRFAIRLELCNNGLNTSSQ